MNKTDNIHPNVCANSQEYIIDKELTVILHENDLPESAITGNVVAIDTETLGLEILHRDRLCLVQLYFPQEGANKIVHCVKIPLAPNKPPVLSRLLSDNAIQKIFHFGRFDIRILSKTFQVEIGNVYCTKIASRFARTNTESHSLKTLCSALLGVYLSKEESGSYWGAEILDKKQLAYAARDVLYLHEIKDKLDAILEREGRLDLALEFINFLPTLVAGDLRGWNESVFTF